MKRFSIILGLILLTTSGAIAGQGVRSGEGLIVKPDDEGSVRIVASFSPEGPTPP